MAWQCSSRTKICSSIFTWYIKLKSVRVPLLEAGDVNDLALLIHHYLYAVLVSNRVVEERYHSTLSLRANDIN